MSLWSTVREFVDGGDLVVLGKADVAVPRAGPSSSSSSSPPSSEKVRAAALRPTLRASVGATAEPGLWAEPGLAGCECGMKTRGGAYFADKVKETATLSRGELLGVELLRTGGPRNGTSGADGCVPGRLDHLVAAARAVAAAGGDSNAPGMLPARVLGGTGAGGGGGGGGCPDCFLLVVNFQIALDDGCFSIVVHVALPTAAQLHAEGTPWAMAALRFLGCSAEHAGASASGGNGEATAAAMDLDTYRNMRLKLIPHWVEAGWLVKSLAGSSPIKLGEYCPPRYHGDGATYLELDVDTSSSTVVSGLFGQLQSSGSDIVLQMGICVEATSSAELPELLLGAFELRRPDFGRAAVAAAGLLPPTATDRGGECVPSNTGAAVAAAAMGAEEGEQESLAADLSRRISTFFSADDVPSPASSGLGAGGRLGAAPTACHAAGSGRHEEEEGGGSLAEDLGRRVSNFFTSPLAFLDDEDGAEQRVCTSGGGAPARTAARAAQVPVLAVSSEPTAIMPPAAGESGFFSQLVPGMFQPVEDAAPPVPPVPTGTESSLFDALWSSAPEPVPTAAESEPSLFDALWSSAPEPRTPSPDQRKRGGRADLRMSAGSVPGADRAVDEQGWGAALSSMLGLDNGDDEGVDSLLASPAGSRRPSQVETVQESNWWSFDSAPRTPV